MSNFVTIGNSMAFAGIANAKDRADMVAFLKSKWANELHLLGTSSPREIS